MTDHLLPCPFCGAEGEIYEAFPNFDYPWHVKWDHDADYCPITLWNGVCFKTKADAIAAWNARSSIEAGRQRGLHEAADMVVKLGYAWTGLHGAIVALAHKDEQ